MPDSSDHIAWFDAICKTDVALVGGKGANLGEMTNAEIPVPPGFVVTTSAYQRCLDEAELGPKLSAHLDGLDPADAGQLDDVAQAIQAEIIAAPMPQQIDRGIREAYSELGEGLVAVRSSATAEDLPDTSFAGQQATFLNITGADEVVRAVQRCWASLFEARAIFYRAQHGWDHLSVQLAVPVQRMVQSETAGVMFTINPVTADRSHVMIEAVHGLGEAAVSGMVTPDSYIASKEPPMVQETFLVPQEQQLIYTPDQTDEAGDHTTWQPVDPDLREQRKLSDDQVCELAALGVRVEEHYGAPQDIEWAWAGGSFYLLQTRPVTGVAGGAV